ncbi:MAG: 4-(cytidine 5'-diphospho)-2-C-methyl-D-erythritol kinase [Candidatus Omnitrophota bacterium]
MLKLSTPAKINLFLEILGKRKDGYHNLKTLFLKVRLFDKINICARKDKTIKISCNVKNVPVNKKNLVFKAVRLMQKYGGLDRGVSINIKKNIPVAAGLGGASSDAAATLFGLNRLWALNLSLKALMGLAKKIGADVPFFLLTDSMAYGTGRGDILKPLKIDKKYWILLVIPKIKVSTKRIYQAFTEDLTKTRDDVKLLTCALRKVDISVIGELLFNRLESVTFNKYRWLGKLKDKISALGARAVLMSGSGAVLFGFFKNREEAIRIRNKLRGINCRLVVVQSM